jgi:hypothetical protein
MKKSKKVKQTLTTLLAQNKHKNYPMPERMNENQDTFLVLQKIAEKMKTMKTRN